MPYPDSECYPQYFYRMEGICDGCNDLGNFYIDCILYRICQIRKISVYVVISTHIGCESNL